MGKIGLKISNTLFKKVDPIGLSVFRIAFSVNLFMEVLHLYKYRSLIYYGINEFNPTLIFIFWIPVILMLMVGFKTKIATVINYIFTVLIFSSLTKYEYHGYMVYIGVSFLMMFLPLSKKISFDALLYKKKVKHDDLVYKVFYFAPVFLVVALIYLDSVVYKITSSMWLSGLGIWLPASLPMNTWSSFPWLLNNEFLVKFLGYFVLIFESVFILLMWFRLFRIPLLVIGVLFHLGILFFFPIPWFALAVICVYILMVPVQFWKKIKVEKINNFVSGTRFLEKYKNKSQEDFCFSEKTIKMGWILFFLVSFSIQLLLIWRTPFLRQLFSESMKEDNSLPHKMIALADKVDYVSHKFIGVTNHGLFLDGHFRGYSNIIKVVANDKGKRYLLPLINEDGQPSTYVKGNLWTNYTFRVSSQNFNLDTYLLNVYPYLVYFCDENNLKISQVQFEFYSKSIEVPKKWKKNYLEKMINRKWNKIGVYSVLNEKLVQKIDG